jgi:hypothetical protein
MPVTKLFNIANITVPSSWIALLIAFAISYFAVRFRYGKLPSELLLDTFFYFIIVWKLSYIITSFTHVLKMPLSIIYYNGGLTGFYLGIGAAIIRILFEIKKRHLSNKEILPLFTGFVIVQAVYQVLMVLLNDGGRIVQLVTILMFGLFGLAVWLTIDKLGDWPAQLAILFVAVHLFVAAFLPQGLTGTSVISTIVLSIGFTAFFYKGREKEFGSGEQL